MVAFAFQAANLSAHLTPEAGAFFTSAISM